MRRLLRGLIFLLVVAALVAGGVYWFAGRGEGPGLTIEKPDRLVGRTGDARGRGRGAGRPPRVALDHARAERQDDSRSSRSTRPSRPRSSRSTAIASASRGRSARRSVPELQAGAARIVVAATRAAPFSICEPCPRSAAKDIQVRLEPPRLSLISTHHYVNHGGSEMVVYRVSAARRRGRAFASARPSSRAIPPPARAWPAPTTRSGSPSSRSRHDQDLSTPVAVLARDEAGNEASIASSTTCSRSRSGRAASSSTIGSCSASCPTSSRTRPSSASIRAAPICCRRSSKINGELRRAERRTHHRRSPRRPLRRGCGTARSSSWATRRSRPSFADHRTYVYHGKEVDQQVHLGFDLAVTAASPVVAANAGQGAARRLARHLRQLRDHRPRHGRRVALRPPVVDRRQGRATRSSEASRSAGAA